MLVNVIIFILEKALSLNEKKKKMCLWWGSNPRFPDHYRVVLLIDPQRQTVLIFRYGGININYINFHNFILSTYVHAYLLLQIYIHRSEICKRKLTTGKCTYFTILWSFIVIWNPSMFLAANECVCYNFCIRTKKEYKYDKT